MQSIAAESGPFFQDALRAFVHKIDPSLCAGWALRQIVFFYSALRAAAK
jgi:hypothetical protein